jgi:hypothetical protein
LICLSKHSSDANKVYFTRQNGIPLSISFSEPYPAEVRRIAAHGVLAFGGNGSYSSCSMMGAQNI